LICIDVHVPHTPNNTDHEQYRQEQVRQSIHQPIHRDLRVDDLCDGDDFGVGEHFGELVDQAAGGIFAAGHDFDDVYVLAVLRETLNGMQMCEQAAVVGRSS